ncbi:hypothetical protein CCMSSC00406_0003386 [Pleurotus cornucopiae]|uniref:Uncharacterized protein n=1 Tax=Pleurotus cornucopiae TaxID=5321 RepID=A0ACB7JCA5_PLECO|nr:hypothetical protein CCMSSC00406_0003386 [Pleurotus cornucopiae]
MSPVDCHSTFITHDGPASFPLQNVNRDDFDIRFSPPLRRARNSRLQQFSSMLIPSGVARDAVPCLLPKDSALRWLFSTFTAANFETEDFRVPDLAPLVFGPLLARYGLDLERSFGIASLPAIGDIYKRSGGRSYKALFARIPLRTIFQDGPEYEARKRKSSFEPPNIALKDVRNAVPPELFERNTFISLFYVIRHVMIVLLFYHLATKIDAVTAFATASLHDYGMLVTSLTSVWLRTVLWLLYAGWQGIALAGLWCLGHEAGHGNLSPHTLVNSALGLLMHSFVLVPYYAWRSTHRTHHKSTNHLDREETHYPATRKTFNLPHGRIAVKMDYQEILEETPAFTLFKMFMRQFLIVTFTYLQHSDPTIPYYRKDQWTFARGALSTVDRPIFGWVGRALLYNIGHDHVAHHLFSNIPFYNLPQATEAIKPILGEYYNYDSTPTIPALWRSFTQCVFVEDEGQVVFFKNAEGEGVREVVEDFEEGAASSSSPPITSNRVTSMRRTAAITASAATSISSYSHPSSPKQSPKPSNSPLARSSSPSLRTSPHPPPPSVAASTHIPATRSIPARHSVVVHPPIPIPPSVAHSTASNASVTASTTSPSPSFAHSPTSKALNTSKANPASASSLTATANPTTHSANAMPILTQHPTTTSPTLTTSHTPALTTPHTPSLTTSPQTPKPNEKQEKKEKPWIDPASLPTHGSVAHIAGNVPERIKHLTQNTFFAYGVGAAPPRSHSTLNHISDSGRKDEDREGGEREGGGEGGGGRDAGERGRHVGEWSGDDFFGYAVGRRVRLVDISVYPSHSSSPSSHSSSHSPHSSTHSSSSYNTRSSSTTHHPHLSSSTPSFEDINGMNGSTSTGVNGGVERNIETSMGGVERNMERLEASTTAEIQVTRGMLNGAGMLHGGCVAYLVDNCCSTPLVVLGLMQGRNGVGVTQAMNVLFHSPAAVLSDYHHAVPTLTHDVDVDALDSAPAFLLPPSSSERQKRQTDKPTNRQTDKTTNRANDSMLTPIPHPILLLQYLASPNSRPTPTPTLHDRAVVILRDSAHDFGIFAFARSL